MIDSALWLDVVSGGSVEAGAPAPPERPFVEAARTAPGKLRIACSTLAPKAALPPTVSEEVKGAVAAMAEVLRGLGHETVEKDPEWGMLGNNSIPRYLRGAAEDFARVPEPERLERRTKGFAKIGSLVPDRAFEAAHRNVAADSARVNAIFDSPRPADDPGDGRHGAAGAPLGGPGRSADAARDEPLLSVHDPLEPHRQPSMAVPAGFAADGMPLSVQIVGRPGAEATLLSLAAQIEAERPWADSRPPIS